MPGPWEKYQIQAEGPWDKYKPQTVLSSPEPSPFPVDSWLHEQVKDQPPEQQAEKKTGFASAAYAMAKPWMDMGYSAASGLNRGMANFSTTLDTWARHYERQGGGARETLFENAAQEYERNTEFWQGLISKEGVGGVGKLLNFVAGVAGEAVPGMADFMLKWASGLYIPFVTGEERAYEEHNVDPTIGGLIEAAKTGTLGLMFKAVAPFSRYIQATVMGASFGAMDAVEAPEGKRLEAFGKGAATGTLLGLTSPSGNLGWRDIYPEIMPRHPDILRDVAEETAKPSVPTAEAERAPAPGKEVQGLRPAVRLADGKVVAGEPGETHPDVLERMAEPTGESGGSYIVQTEDHGNIQVQIIRSKDGSVAIFSDKPTITYNAEFSKGKTNEQILKYAFEPLGYMGIQTPEMSPREPPTTPAPGSRIPTEEEYYRNIYSPANLSLLPGDIRLSEEAFAIRTPGSVFHGTSPENSLNILNEGEISPRISTLDNLRQRSVSLSKSRPVAEGMGTVAFEVIDRNYPEITEAANLGKKIPPSGFEMRSNKPIPLTDIKRVTIALGTGESIEQFPRLVELTRRLDEKGIPYRVLKTEGRTYQEYIHDLERTTPETPSQEPKAAPGSTIPKAPAAEPERGFLTPDGAFLDRTQAAQWVADNEPEVHRAWQGIAGEGAEFHSEDYNQAAQERMRPGPGAATAGVLDPDISQLAERLKTIPRDTSFDDRVSLADTLKKKYTGVLGGIKTAWAGMKATSEVAWDWYKRPPQWTTFDDMWGKFIAARQKNGILRDRFAKQILERFPDREQRAISNFMQANGDEAVLRQRADQTTDPELKQGYEDALRLPDEAKDFARQARAYWDARLDEYINAGILDHGIENYVMQVWEKDPDNPVAQRLLAEANSGKLAKNPAFAKKRFWESYFEGEQAGKIPKDKRIGFLIAAYQQMGDEAIAARQLITQLSKRNGTDGRPLVVTKGVGQSLPKGETPAEAYVINPNAVGPVYAKDPATGKRLKDPLTGESVEVYTGDYRTIDNPSLRKHKWATADNEGNPIFVQGDVKVHPEVYEKLDPYLGKSLIRDYWVGRAALRLGAEVKGTLLGFFSPFHQVHLSLTAVTHAVNPFADVLPDKIDLDDPLTSKLIDHSLKVYDSDGMAAFSEGMERPGLERFIPYVGEYSARYQEYLFGPDGFIPRLKVHFAQVAYKRNRARYPDLSDDQVLKLSADQANAAFGGQNYEFMGRSKTLQDFLRLGALAPNFLESRIRSAGQALMPYGKEQFTSLVIRGAIGMYVLARIAEGIASKIDPEKNEVHWDRPFSATIDGKEYSLRSEQGDIWHLISDPRSFVYYRLSPAIAKPAIEAVTGRDNWGRKKDVKAQIKDWATSAVPMAGQGFFNRRDYDPYQSILQSLGITSWNARTEAEKMVIEIQSEKGREVLPPATAARMQLRGQLGRDYKKTQDFESIRQAALAGKITTKDVQAILERSIMGDVARGVTGFSVPDALKVWDQANEKERAAIQPMLIRKWFSWQATMDEREPYTEQMEQVMAWRPPKPAPAKRFSIRGMDR